MKRINFLTGRDFKCFKDSFKKLCTILFVLTFIVVFENKANSQDTSIYQASNLTALSGNGRQKNAPESLQQQRITGTVTNEAGDPLPGTTIQVEGTILGAITDGDGKYSIEVPDQKAVIIFSFVGYITQRFPVAGKSTIDVTLVSASQNLQEVVVIGYGTQKKTSITGSVSIVKGDEVAKIPVANISNSIAGKLAGVTMRPNGGQPGKDNPELFIRGVGTTGANSPLIVIDGIIRNNINQLDPTTIESVSVLKDAAAVAPYGLGGANGVILITTKKGTKGVPTLTLNSYYGWQTPTYYPDYLMQKII